jgi:hypothetical protein
MKHSFASFYTCYIDGCTQHQQRAALHYQNEDDEDDYDEYEVDPKGNKQNLGYRNSFIFVHFKQG